jgi:unspecific monooxygenase
VPRGSWPDVVPLGDGLFGVTSHALAMEVLADARRFSSRFGTGRRHVEFEGRSVNLDDPPRSTELRRELLRAVVVPPNVEAVADQLLARLINAGGGDLVTEFAQPLSLAVFGAVFGVTDAAELNELGALTRALPRAEGGPAFHEANQALLSWLRVRSHESRGGAFFELGAQLAANDRLFLQRFLAQTGFESTAMAIALSVDALVSSGLPFDSSERAAEELLRFTSPLIRFMREVTDDTTLGVHSLRKGERLAVFFPLVNRDARVFERPHELMLERASNPHLAFGHGPHACVGRSLARAQLQAALTALAGVSRPRVVTRTPLRSAVTRGLNSMQVVLDDA